MKQKLIVILGPTASGKTEMALRLAEEFRGEIVSADSRQIYLQMDIGTSKTKDVHLVDIIEPDQEFTLAQYKKLAIKTIKDIQKRGKVPFLVGGTGLYIQAVVDNLQIPKVKPNKILRSKLEKQSIEELFKTLKALDPQAVEIIEQKNKRRLIRAIEVCLSGQKFSQKTKGEPLFNVLQIGLKKDKEKLSKKIGQRVDQMIEQGLVDEVESLAQKYDWNLPSMSGIGYQEFKDFFAGKISLEKAIREIKTHTRQYARRQMTWFKRDKRINWIKNYQEGKKLVTQFLSQ